MLSSKRRGHSHVALSQRSSNGEGKTLHGFINKNIRCAETAEVAAHATKKVVNSSQQHLGMANKWKIHKKRTL
ncbi:hypothetical protein HJC23_002145 [Cyclotella cryptica]|uniref:Uncharacterized protein n=1 Tax=Cyclotella cryptica TaxID=29204 RepID=A0ABD3Q796_9STRA